MHIKTFSIFALQIQEPGAPSSNLHLNVSGYEKPILFLNCVVAILRNIRPG